MLTKTASPDAINLIKKFESCRLSPYLDQGGIPTIGWGTTGPGITMDMKSPISQAFADQWLLNDVVEIAKDVDDMLSVDVSQPEFDALVCLAFNIGAGALHHSTIIKLINQEQFAKAADLWTEWDHVDGVEVKGLLNRRLAEKALFLKE